MGDLAGITTITDQLTWFPLCHPRYHDLVMAELSLLFLTPSPNQQMEKTFSTAENWAKKGRYTDKKKKSQENDFQGLAKPLNSYNVRTCNFSSHHHTSVE